LTKIVASTPQSSLKRNCAATTCKSLLALPNRSLLRLTQTLGRSEDDSIRFETVCECDGSYCGAHHGNCGNLRILNIASSRRAIACVPCTKAHGGLLLAEKARQRKVPDSIEIDEALRRIYRQPNEYDLYGSTYPRLTLSQLAQRFRRTRSYLRRRAEELNLTQRQVKPYPKWTETEERIVERHAHLSPTVIHQKLKNDGYERTVVAIRDRISLLRFRQRARTRLPHGSSIATMMVGPSALLRRSSPTVQHGTN
jgi:hypothetical protein